MEASSEINDIRVFSNSGQSMLHQSGLSAFSSKLDVSGVAPGVYLVRLKMEGKSAESSKLVVR